MNSQTTNVSSQDAQIILLKAMERFRDGDFSVQIETQGDENQTMERIFSVFNEIAQTQMELVNEMKACNRAGGDGRLSYRAKYSKTVPMGGWWEILHQVNRIIDQVELRTGETRRALESLARGDLSTELSLVDDRGLELGGEYAKIAHSINEISCKSDLIAWQVSKLAKDLTEGKLGVQIPWTNELDGRWKAMADDLNTMSKNVREHVRTIAEVTCAVQGDNIKSFTEGDKDDSQLESPLSPRSRMF